MPLLYLLSCVNDIDNIDNIDDYAFLTRDKINIYDLVNIKNNNIKYYETIYISNEIFDKIINLYKFYSIVKITIINGTYTLFIDNYQIILLQKILQKKLNKNFCNIFIYV